MVQLKWLDLSQNYFLVQILDLSMSFGLKIRFLVKTAAAVVAGVEADLLRPVVETVAADFDAVLVETVVAQAVETVVAAIVVAAVVDIAVIEFGAAVAIVALTDC